MGGVARHVDGLRRVADVERGAGVEPRDGLGSPGRVPVWRRRVVRAGVQHVQADRRPLLGRDLDHPVPCRHLGGLDQARCGGVHQRARPLVALGRLADGRDAPGDADHGHGLVPRVVDVEVDDGRAVGHHALRLEGADGDRCPGRRRRRLDDVRVDEAVHRDEERDAEGQDGVAQGLLAECLHVSLSGSGRKM